MVSLRILLILSQVMAAALAMACPTLLALGLYLGLTLTP